MAVSMQLPRESTGAAKGALLHARCVARSPFFTRVEYEDQPALAASLCHTVVILDPVRAEFREAATVPRYGTWKQTSLL